MKKSTTTSDLAGLSYRELQARCKAAGLKCSGKTQQLRARLAAHLETAPPAAAPSAAAVPSVPAVPAVPAASADKKRTKQQAPASRPTKRKRASSAAAGPASSSSAAASTAAILSSSASAATSAAASGAGHVGNLLGSVAASKTRGLNVSGKWWKHPQKRSSNRTNKKDQKRLWDKKMKGKQAYKQMKEIEGDFLARRQEEKQARIDKMIAKRKRKQENELKTSQYQTISNDSKIKRMSKKQLRLVKRMQVNTQTGVAQLVSPWAGRQIRGKFTNNFGRTGR
jgi:rRNA-processing protein CGR1